ncbi:MAG: hypothetical protein ACOC5T_01155 [Elusimicrobiota bacterium]
MAEIDVKNVTLDGLELEYTAASSEDTFANSSDNTRLYLKNSDTSSRTATIVAQKECNHGELHDQEVEVPGETTVVVEDIESARFNDENGKVHITYDGDEGDFEVAVTR